MNDIQGARGIQDIFMHFRVVGACRRRVSRLAMSGSPGRDVAACLRAFSRSSDDPPGSFLAPGASVVGCHSYRRRPYRKCPFPRWWSCQCRVASNSPAGWRSPRFFSRDWHRSGFVGVGESPQYLVRDDGG